MSDVPPFTVLGLNDFKTHLCKHMQALHAGEADSYVIRRFRRPVALVLSVSALNRKKREEDEAAAHTARTEALARHAEQRRRIKARLLSHPRAAAILAAKG